MMGDISRFNCPLCGSSNCHARLVDGPVRVVKCAACGVAWRQGELPVTPSAMSGVRFDGHLIKSAPGWDGPPMNSEGLRSDTLSASHLGLLEIEVALELKRPPGALLNVGLDTLDFLENAKVCGWSAISVADLAALPQPGAMMRRDVNDIQEESEQGGYDVIRLEGILERSRDPVAAIRRAAQFQNQAGLLIVSGADAGAFDYPLYGEGASLSRADLPRWFFTAKSLGVILRKAGFSIVRLKALKEPPHISIFARRSMRQQYRHLRRWIDPQAPMVHPRPQRPVPA